VLRDTQGTRDDASDTAGAEARPVRAPRYPYAREMVAGGLYAALLIVVLRLAAAPLSNTDTYFHLRFGAEFLDGWSLRHPGSVSTFATADWLPTQWLSEVVMAQTERWGGLAAVAWLYGVVRVVLLTTIYRSARRWCGPLLAAGLTLLAFLTASQQLWMRPQLLSFLLVCVTATAWLRTRDDGRVRWWLVPVTWVWAMTHGMWPIGIGLGVVTVVGLALDRAMSRRDLTRAALVPVASAVAAALTPVGPALYGAVLGVGSRAQYFSEWDSPDFTTVSCEALGAMLVLGVGFAIRRQVRTWLDVVLLLVCGVCAVWSWRTVPVAAMILVPLVASLSRTGRGRVPTPRRLELGLLTGAGAAVLVALALLVPTTADDPPSQPSWVDPALSSLPAGTKVVDSWDYGGYLMWRYPQLDLLAHGYGDTFTIPELQRNTDILGLAPGWDDELRRTGCTVAVLRPTALAYALEHQEHWEVLHRSAGIVELQAPPGWGADLAAVGQGSRSRTTASASSRP
jgi:hypothetical protein